MHLLGYSLHHSKDASLSRDVMNDTSGASIDALLKDPRSFPLHNPWSGFWGTEGRRCPGTVCVCGVASGAGGSESALGLVDMCTSELWGYFAR
jgi:hypothetical protein